MTMLVVDLCFASAITFCLYIVLNGVGELYQSF